MENLFSRLELLLGDFVANFLNRLLESKEFQPHQDLPGEFEGQLRLYIEKIQGLQLEIERFSPASKEDAYQKSRALALLKSSSDSIFGTFHRIG